MINLITHMRECPAPHGGQRQGGEATPGLLTPRWDCFSSILYLLHFELAGANYYYYFLNPATPKKKKSLILRFTNASIFHLNKSLCFGSHLRISSWQSGSSSRVLGSKCEALSSSPSATNKKK
jgi:hypothetical protein